MKSIYKHLCSISIVVLACVANIALAHNTLKATSPTADAELLQAPTAIDLAFSDDTYLEALELLKGDTKIDIGFEADATRSSAFTITLPQLAPGNYTVNWMVVGDDTHEIKGSFSFVVADPE